MNAAFDPSAVKVEQAALDDPAVRAAIEAWVCERADSTPFHRPAWICAVARGTGQQAIMLVARDMFGHIVGVLPLTFIRSFLFGKALVSSGFAVDGGILAETERAASALADACWSLAGDNGCSTAELRGGTAPQGWIVKTDAYLGFSRPLADSDEAELLAIPKRHRAEVRKSLDKELTIETGRGPGLRAIHYKLYADSVHRLGTPVFPRALFDAVLDAFGKDAEIAVASKDGTPVSAVISLFHRDAIMPYWHGAAIESRALRSNEFLYYRLMNLARERGIRIFDFGRSKVGTGPAAWKKTWGFEGVPLGYAVRAADGQAPRDVNPLSPQYRRKVEMWKKLPLPIANLIGPWLARGLG